MPEAILIRGMGLAGCLLGHALERRKLPFHIVDAGWSGAASPKAAGLINPLAGRALALAPAWHTLWPFARDNYRSLERILDRSILNERLFWTVFQSEEEARQWQKAGADNERRPFLDASVQKDQDPFIRDSPFGGIAVRGGAQVDIAGLLTASKQRWQQQNRYMEGHCASEDLHATGDGGWLWMGTRYTAVVCCGGAMDHRDPYWAFLGIRPNAGERWLLEIPDSDPSSKHARVYRKAGLLAPMPNGQWWLGSANRWDSMDEGPSERGEAHLQQRAEGLLGSPYRLLEHGAGIRATMKDRRPVLGPHPEHEGLWCFNGLGTKGSLWAPWHAEALAEGLAQSLKRQDRSLQTDAAAQANTPKEQAPYEADQMALETQSWPPVPDRSPRLIKACLPVRFWP
jgi:glycine/D-amino acid oxidase-like deaminating enzyme